MPYTSLAASPRLNWHSLPGAAVVFVGLVACWGLWQHQQATNQALAQARFERQARSVVDALQRRIESKTDLLHGARALLTVNPDLTRSAFEWMASSLRLERNHPDVKNLNFTRAVPAGQRDAFEAQARANAHLDGSLPTQFTIHPGQPQDEYFVVDYLWPRLDNQAVLGLEIHSQPANLEAMQRARSTGVLVASAPLDLVQEREHPVGIIMRLPVFVPSETDGTTTFIGAVGVSMRVFDLVGALQEHGIADGLALTLHDAGVATRANTVQPATLLYTSAEAPMGAEFRQSYELPIGGRRWRIDFAPTRPLLSPQEVRLPALVAGGSLLVTALLTALVGLLVRRRAQALAVARRAASAARESESRFRSAFNQAAVGMVQIDSLTGALERANQRFCDIVGYEPHEVLVLRIEDLSEPGDLPRARALMRQLVTGELAEFRREVRLRRKDGSAVWVDATVSSLRSDHGPRRQHLVVVQDITQRRKSEEELRYLAYNDLLTGLPNRRLLLDRMEQALAMHARHKTWGALLLLDLDHFKTLNEIRGHDAGDRLLREVAQRLRGCISGDDTLARQGGDEFVVLLKEGGTASEEAAAHAEEVVRAMLAALAEPFDLGQGEPYHTTLSVGVTVFDGNGEPAEELLKRSELAMYEAKTAGRNTLRFFDPRMQAVVAARVQLEADMRAGLAAGQFELYYQPKVGRGAIEGAEALLRWRHPQRGFVPPSEFIPRAEESGLILQLGQWVLDTACLQLAQWSDHPALGHFTVAVNVSPRQFREPGFVAQVLQALASTGADAARLRLELTEGMLLQDVDDTIEKMGQLRSYGVCFSLDDFGTGYSSLAYLKRLPLDELKIDQSFVRDVLTDPNDAAIARTIVALGTSLGLQVIAEGVETEAQRQFLERSGCHVWQGYLLAPPLPRERFEALALQRAAAAP